MSKEFTVHLTSKNRWDLWLFLYRLGGVKAQTRDQVRNLEAVCDTFQVSEIQSRLEDVSDQVDSKMSHKDFADVESPCGSVDLKRLYDYLGTMPDGIDPALAIRLLKLSDYLQDVKDRKPTLAAVPEEGA